MQYSRTRAAEGELLSGLALPARAASCRATRTRGAATGHEFPSDEHPTGSRTRARPWDEHLTGSRGVRRRPGHAERSATREDGAPRSALRPWGEHPTGNRSAERPRDELPTGSRTGDRASRPGKRPWVDRPTGARSPDRSSRRADRPWDERPTGNRRTERPWDARPAGARLIPGHDSENESVFPQSPGPSFVVTRLWKKYTVSGASPETVVLDCMVSGSEVQVVRSVL